MTYEERADRIAAMIEEHLGIRGKSLERKLKRAGRLLPKSIQRDGQTLVEAVRLQGSAKLARMVDDSDVQRAYRACEKYLSEIDPWDRRKGKILGFLSTNAFNILVTASALVAVLMWRDLI